MATQTSSSDSESHWYDDDQEFLPTLKKFHDSYAMPPDTLKDVKEFNDQNVLKKLLDFFCFCTEFREIGSSYEGVKVVRSAENKDFEFDVMCVLKIPESCLLCIAELPERPGYAMLIDTHRHTSVPDHYRSTNHKFFAECLTSENGLHIVDAGKTTAAFFGELQKWVNTKPVQGFDLLPRQHGTAIQLDVYREQVVGSKKQLFYSLDISPTFEIWREDEWKRYVAKPEKKRTPDSITWRQLFQSEERDAEQLQLLRSRFRADADELCNQLSELHTACAVLEARIRLPLPEDAVRNFSAALAGHSMNYRVPSVNLQDLKESTSRRIVAVTYPYDQELEVLPVPEKPGYAWLKLTDAVSVSSPLNEALKLCYLPGGKYLDIKAASDMLVKELQGITDYAFKDQDAIVGRDGPVVQIDVYPDKKNKMEYFCLEIVFAAYVDGNFYVGLPHDYDDVPDKKAWRRSSSLEETTEIQQAPEGLKMVFRILKAIRNSECGLAQLTSYHFKTLLLKQLRMVNSSEDVSKIFIRVLKHLKGCLIRKNLQTCFVPVINVFGNMTNDCKAHMGNRIKNLLSKRGKMFGALKRSGKELAYDCTRQPMNDSSQPFLECRSMSGSSNRPEESQLHTEIEKQLFGYDLLTITNTSVYEDLNVYRICPGEAQFATNCYAIMIIHNNKKNLRAKQLDFKVSRLERRTPTASASLLQTVLHDSGLADTRKTAEYIKQQMETLINKSPLLLKNVSIRLEGSNLVLNMSSSNLQLNILPGYEIGSEIFVAMPGVTDPSAWMPIAFTPVRNKFWKAFQINDCGKRVVNELRDIRNHEPRLAQLTEHHLRMATFWEMEVERDWSDDKMKERLHGVLDRLLTSVKNRNLPNYFDPKDNTLKEF